MTPEMATNHHNNNHNHKDTSNTYSQLNYAPGAKWVKSLTRDRLNNFLGGHYSNMNLSSVLFTHRLDKEEFVKLKVFVCYLS